ncbi:polypyrimidine tract-binding protein 3 [Patagioenas fasciata monilis]|uniref:Polypyrimidine tract-binding protein 3 n=1 Tax=Patagioenas fasciata monilis TaxID=372326 RepID=A0A1V4KY22_PATFA|nr:polypyrimidine tract-binding protein 3 [Patagioenas fasciata monilis]
MIQAFLEMATGATAVNVMNYYAPAVPLFHSQPVFIQYPDPRDLRIDNLPNQARAQAMYQALNTMQFGNQAATGASDAGDGLCPGLSCVLRIIVENVFHPVTLEVLHQVLSSFGSVLKIIIFTKYSKFQALVQYDNPRSAYCAKMTLNGRSIYTSGCTLRVDFSKFTSLTVKYNNEKSRDFTRLDLPSGAGQIYMDQPVPAAYVTQNNSVPSYTEAAGFTPPVGFAEGAGNLVPPVPAAVTTPAAPGQTTCPDFSENSVLLVSNLNPKAVTPHGLFILFGVYGNVHRVKIMFRMKEKALIQMADANQARLAISNLNGQRLYGRVLHATFSKHQTVQLLRKGQDDHGLTKDYSDSPLHRFKVPGSKNFQNIFPPSATLHLSNIPSCVTVDDMKNLFASTGCTVKGFRFFRNNCRTALIQLGSVEEAVHALIELHNRDLGQNRNLRVSFSKHTL